MSYDSEVLADVPLIYYKLNETSGTVALDSSGNGYHGVYSGGVTLGRPSMVIGSSDTSALFDGSTGVATSNAMFGPASYSQFSFDGMMDATGIPSGGSASIGQIACFNNDGDSVVVFAYPGFTAGGLLLTWLSNEIASNSLPLLPGGTHHVAGTWDGAESVLYIDGLVVALQRVVDGAAQPVPATLGSTLPFQVGNDLFANAFPGRLQNVAFYPTALSAQRVAIHAGAAQGSQASQFVSTDALITQVEDHLLGGDRDELNFLAADMGSGDLTLTLSGPLNNLAAGSYLGIELEVLYVKSVDPTSQQVTVRRGMLGSTAAIHSSDTQVYINPLFSKWQIYKALNVEIVSLSGADNGLFAERAFTLTSQTVKKTYDVPASNADLRQILEIRWNATGAEANWPRVGKRSYQIIRDVTMDSTTATGLALRIEESFTPGRRIVVRYAGDFTQLSSNLNDNAAATTGLSNNMIDIPALGAAARLMGVREAKRSFVERAVDSRRAGEVPPGSSSRSAAVLLQLLNGRIKSEADRLKHLWPDTSW